MANRTYKKATTNNFPVQVESAIRDGKGKNIENNYAKQNGYYGQLGVGEAKNLIASIGTTDTSPYIFRTTGGNADVTDRKRVDKIVARTVKYNQLVQIADTSRSATSYGITMTDNRDGTYTLNGTATGLANFSFILSTAISYINGHIYYLGGCAKGGSSLNGYYIADTDQRGIYDVGEGVVYESSKSTTLLSALRIRVIEGCVCNDVIIKPILIDLTNIFGAGNEPTTLEQFYATDLGKIVKAGYYLPYSTGALLTTDITKMVNVGYNAYDNTHSTDFVKVIGGLKYTLEGTYTSVELYDINKTLLSDTFVSEQALPESCAFVKIVGGNNTTCFHLTWSGSRTGYEPYSKHEYATPFKGYGVGDVGDEYYPYGHIVRKMGSIDLGTLNWQYTSGSEFFYCSLDGVKFSNDLLIIPNIICDLYTTRIYGYVANINAEDMGISINGKDFTPVRLVIKNKSYTDATAFKQAMSGKILYFEKTTPTTEQGLPYESNQIVDDYGTEEFVFDSEVSIPSPVGHQTFYQVNLQNFLQRVYQRVSGDPADIAKVSDITSVKETNANTNLKFWVGTQAQYDAITTKDNNTQYIITEA